MISIDTNVVIKFLTHDDDSQFRKAYKLFKTRDIFIPDTVILESEWVLRYAYEFKTDEISEAFTRLFGLKNIHLSNPVFIAQAIEWHREGLDFADALHLVHSQEHKRFFTFGKDLIKKARGLTDCMVLIP